jgi:hypothetical protein|tara:strand:+ start:102 stop:302 length:201 start_codon:yes stop_codon:yes gene_type:complete
MKKNLDDRVLKKQLWETREMLEHNYGIPRDLDIRTVELDKIDDSMKANMIGWVEALSWTIEKIGDK